MAFQIKDFASIVAGALNHLRGSTDRITDFRPGSVARTLVEGPSVEIEQLYQQMFIGLREAIPVATFQSFGFDRLPAARAYGTLIVTREDVAEEAVTIPLGTSFLASDGRTYLSTAAVVWPADATFVEVPVQSSLVGLAGNISAGGIVSSGWLSGLGYATEIQSPPISTGRDQESDLEREARFAEYIRSISRGTVDAVMYAAKQAQVTVGGVREEYVTRAGIIENPGRVLVFLYSSHGTPSDALIADGQRRIDGYYDSSTGLSVPGYRGAGVRVDVLPMVERVVTFGVQVAMFPGFALDANVENDMTDIFDVAVRNIAAGGTLYVGTLVERLLTVRGVRKVVPLPGSNENILCAQNEVLIPGAFAVDALNE